MVLTSCKVKFIFIFLYFPIEFIEGENISVVKIIKIFVYYFNNFQVNWGVSLKKNALETKRRWNFWDETQLWFLWQQTCKKVHWYHQTIYMNPTNTLTKNTKTFSSKKSSSFYLFIFSLLISVYKRNLNIFYSNISSCGC